jgi:excisionase family DNA binding protein
MPDWFPPPSGTVVDGEFVADEAQLSEIGKTPAPASAPQIQPPSPNSTALLKLAEVEKELRCTRKTVLNYINSGKLRAHKVNAYWRVKRVDLDKFMAGETDE